MTPLWNVPSVAQSNAFCGPASLSAVLKFYGVPVGEQRVASWAGATRKWGTWAEGLVLAARRAGFRASIHDGKSLSDLARYLQLGPVIVSWQYEGGGHYSVVRGLDHQYVYMMEPVTGENTRVPLKEFEAAWFDCEEEGDVCDGRIERRLIFVQPWRPGRFR